MGFYVQRTTGLLNCQMDFMVWCCDVITSTCLNMFSMNWTSFPRILFMSDLLIFAALLLPKNRCNTPQTPLHHYSRFLKRINVSKYLFKRACDHRMYLKDLIEKGLHFLLIFLTCCWGAYSGVTVIYFYLHLKTEETKKYNVSKLPMPKKKSEHCSTFCFNSTTIF